MSNLCCVLNPYKVCTTCGVKWCEVDYYQDNTHYTGSDFRMEIVSFFCPKAEGEREYTSDLQAGIKRI